MINVIKFFLTGYLVFIVLTITQNLFFVSSESITPHNPVLRIILYSISVIPSWICFYLCVVLFSRKEIISDVAIQEERIILNLSSIGVGFLLVYNKAKFTTQSNNSSLFYYFDIVNVKRKHNEINLRNKLVYMNFLTKNYAYFSLEYFIFCSVIYFIFWAIIREFFKLNFVRHSVIGGII